MGMPKNNQLEDLVRIAALGGQDFIDRLEELQHTLAEQEALAAKNEQEDSRLEIWNAQLVEERRRQEVRAAALDQREQVVEAQEAQVKAELEAAEKSAARARRDEARAADIRRLLGEAAALAAKE